MSPGYGDPTSRVQIGKPQHALELWESVCDTNQDLSAQPPLLLLPQEYEWFDREAGSVEMAKLIYYNKLVRSSSSQTPNLKCWCLSSVCELHHGGALPFW